MGQRRLSQLFDSRSLEQRGVPLAKDSALDILTNTSFGLTSLLNLNNPAPSAPAMFASTTILQASTTSGGLNAQITLTATVSGVNPTSLISFAAGGNALGTATLMNGTATLQTSFASAGSYSVTATYRGDSNNVASSSNAVTIVVVAPDFTVTTQPSSATITAGQSATFTFTVTPVGGYSGTVKFSCGLLPSEASCSFSPATVASSSGSALTSTLTITTSAAMSRLGTDSEESRHSAGSDAVTVTVADSGNGPQHPLKLNLTIQ